MGILSIQSQVVSGHVGNSAAVFALQSLGQDVWAVPTVLLSHHPGHRGSQGAAISNASLAALLDGLTTRGCFNRCDAILSGYLGEASTAEIVLDALKRARLGSPHAIYLCDPVMGDDGSTYVGPGIISAMHNLAAFADIMTPNGYELTLLTGMRPTNLQTAVAALRRLQMKGLRIAILTDLVSDDGNWLNVVAVDGQAAMHVTLPRLPPKFSGAGDVFAALFLGDFLTSRNTMQALERACASLNGILRETTRRGADELLLIAAQSELRDPSQIFRAEPII